MRLTDNLAAGWCPPSRPSACTAWCKGQKLRQLDASRAAASDEALAQAGGPSGDSRQMPISGLWRHVPNGV